MTIKRALISVSDKTGLIELARCLHEQRIEIIATGGTAKSITDAKIPVIEISDYTGFPEILDGRVKTLNAKVFAGILARGDTDQKTLQELDISTINLVIVNLYPFAAVTAKTHQFNDAIENIDIGGPSLIRASAKNFAHVAVVVDPNDYASVMANLKQQQSLDQAFRFQLAQKAFAYTAAYDAMIANYLGKKTEAEPVLFPKTLSLQFEKCMDLRYGENPQQQAALYRDVKAATDNVANAEILQGKSLSYNNIADGDAALTCVKAFQQPACVIVKHANPCGVAVSDNLTRAYERAYRTDPTSAFGGIIAFNRAVDAETAKRIIEQQFVEVIIAPSFSAEALQHFSTKPNVRLLATGDFIPETKDFSLKQLAGGILIQENDAVLTQLSDLEIVTTIKPTEKQLQDLIFAWRVVKYVKSNAIVYAKDEATIGIGAGQMSRVYSARIAGIKAADEGLTVSGAVMASDAFFPFRDSVDEAAKLGIVAIIQPGGSKRDDEVIQAANEHGIAMAFTGVRHFLH